MRPYSFLGGNRGLTRLLSGQLFYVNTDDRSITPWIIDSGYWELFVDDILCALARPGDTFVDVGANMGYYTIKIGARVGAQGMIYSFEPNPETYGFLFDNVMINGFEARSSLVCTAVGEEAGQAWLSFQRREPGGSTVRTESLGLENEMAVRVEPLDALIPADRRVDLVKIDVEGFEPLVLRGMQGILARSPDAAVVVELSHILWSRFGDPLTQLKAAAQGRDIYRIHANGQLQRLPADNPASLLEADFVSYLLLLPPTAARRAQVARFLGDGRTAQPISPQLSLSRRIARRLRSLLKD